MLQINNKRETRSWLLQEFCWVIKSEAGRNIERRFRRVTRIYSEQIMLLHDEEVRVKQWRKEGREGGWLCWSGVILSSYWSQGVAWCDSCIARGSRSDRRCSRSSLRRTSAIVWHAATHKQMRASLAISQQRDVTRHLTATWRHYAEGSPKKWQLNKNKQWIHRVKRRLLYTIKWHSVLKKNIRSACNIIE